MVARAEQKAASLATRFPGALIFGAYQVEGLGVALFAAMRGADFTGIIGLPMTQLVALLARFDVDVIRPERAG